MTDLASRAVQDGSWFGIFGREVVVLVPARERPRVAELWAAVDDGARFEEVLDLLVSGGLRAVHDFVLVAAAGSAARVLVRGAASVSVHSHLRPAEVRAGDRVWAEESFNEVFSMVATLPDSGATGAEVDAPAGLRRVGSVSWGTNPVAAPVPEPAFAPVTQPVIEPVPEPVPVSEPVSEPAQTPVPVPAPIPSGPMTAPLVAGLEPLPADAEPPTWGQPEAAAFSADAETGEQPPVDHDGMTQSSAAHLSPPPLPGIPGQPQPPAVTSHPVARLVFSHGSTVAVDRVILIGRAPEARRFAPSDQPQLVTVPSPHQEISSTHLEVRPGSGVDHAMAVATDLGSTNGTMLMQPGLPPEDLKPGIAVQLIPGAIIDLGDGVTIQVTRP